MLIKVCSDPAWAIEVQWTVSVNEHHILSLKPTFGNALHRFRSHVGGLRSSVNALKDLIRRCVLTTSCVCLKFVWNGPLQWPLQARISLWNQDQNCKHITNNLCGISMCLPDWIALQGLSVNAVHKELPASPLQQVLSQITSFLSGCRNASWQWNSSGISLPQCILVDYLFTLRLGCKAHVTDLWWLAESSGCTSPT